MQSNKTIEFEDSIFNDGNICSHFYHIPPDIRGYAIDSPLHYQSSVEFVLTETIHGDAYIGGKKYEYGLSDLAAFYVPPGIVHGFHYYDGSGMILVCHLNLTSLGKYINLQKIYPLGSLEAAPDLYDVIKEALLIAIDENNPVDVIIISIMRIFSSMHQLDTKQSGTGMYKTSGLSYEELHTIIDWTEANLHRPIQLSEAAAQLGYNKNYFCQKFKESNHTTYLTYLNSARMRKACDLLHDTDSIEAVCNACGFQNESYFIKLFTRIVGITPSNYRKNIKNKSRY